MTSISPEVMWDCLGVVRGCLALVRLVGAAPCAVAEIGVSSEDEAAMVVESASDSGDEETASTLVSLSPLRTRPARC